MAVNFSQWIQLLSENTFKTFDEFSCAFLGTADEKKKIIKDWLGYENMEEIVIGAAKFTKNFVSNQDHFEKNKIPVSLTYEYIVFGGETLSKKINTARLDMITTADDLTEILLALPIECRLDLINQIPAKKLFQLYTTGQSFISTLKALDDEYYQDKNKYGELYEDKRPSEYLAQKIGLDHLQDIIQNGNQVDEIIRLIDKNSRHQTPKITPNVEQNYFLKRKYQILSSLNDDDPTSLMKFLTTQFNFDETKEIIMIWLGYEEINDHIDVSYMINTQGERIQFDPEKIISHRQDDSFKQKFISIDALQTVLFVLPIEIRLDFLNRFCEHELFSLIHHIDHFLYLFSFLKDDKRQLLLLFHKLKRVLPLIILKGNELDLVINTFKSRKRKLILLQEFASMLNKHQLSNYENSAFYNQLNHFYKKTHPNFFQKILAIIFRFFRSNP